MITSEFFPFAKTGGLGDAVSALSADLLARGHDVRILMPFYRTREIRSLRLLARSCFVHSGKKNREVRLFEGRFGAKGAAIYFLHEPNLFNEEEIYGAYREGNGFKTAERFNLLSRVPFVLCRILKWIPHIFHCHDWHTALIPYYLKREKSSPCYGRTASVLSIHNLGYQGIFDESVLSSVLSFSPREASSAGLPFKNKMNFLQSGLVNADIITTVSPTYAAEIQTKKFGCGLDYILQARRSSIYGILNGIDEKIWDPETDKYLSPYFFKKGDWVTKKKLKIKILKEMKMEVREELPLIIMAGRLAEQKGIKALFESGYGCIPWVCHSGKIQFIVLGTGEKWCEEELRFYQKTMKNFRAQTRFSESLLHRLVGAGDFLLMPSLYEPCGLNQMYCQRYGTIPIAGDTGGLKDTIQNYSDSSLLRETPGEKKSAARLLKEEKRRERENEKATGFLFKGNQPEDIIRGIQRALHCWYREPEIIRMMRENGMSASFSWRRSSKAYEKVYQFAETRNKQNLYRMSEGRPL